MTSSNQFDPLSTYFLDNAFAELKRMRDAGRAFRHEDTLKPVTSFFKASDVRAMANDWKLWSSQRTEEFNKGSLGIAAILMGDDPPFHTAIKNIVMPHFLPGAIRRYEDIIARHVETALDKCVGAGSIDYFRDVAEYVTTATICSIAGVPDSDRDLMLELSREHEKVDGRPVFWKAPEPETEKEVEQLSQHARAYFAPLRERKYFDMENGLFGKLAEVVPNDDHLVGLCSLLIFAGIKTTSSQMTHLLQELVNNPDQMAILRQDSDRLIVPAIEESLRLRGTARKVTRFASSDIDVAGVRVAKDEAVVLWLASANRDEDVIERGDEFDILRSQNRHITFGTGIHLCVGNALARAEMRILMKSLLARTKEIRESRGPDSYARSTNAMSEVPVRYDVELIQ